MPAPLKVVADFTVRDTTLDTYDPFVTAMPDGRAVIGLTSEFSEPNNVDQRFVTVTGTTTGGSGTWLGSGVVGDDAEEMLTVAATNGNLAFGVWADAATPASQHEIVGRFFNPATGAVIGVSTGFTLANNADDEIKPTVTALQNGNFAVFWLNATTNTIVGTIVDPLGSPGAQIPISTTPAGSAFRFDSQLLPNGNIAVVWDGHMRIMTPGLSGATAEIVLPGTAVGESSMAVLADGRFVVASQSGDGSSFAIRYTIYNQDGSQSTTNFIDNANSTLDDDGVQVTAFHDGRFMLVWYSLLSNTIVGQVVRADGTVDGAAFTVNTDTTLDVRTPSIATMADGRVIVTWHVDSAVNNEDLVRAAIFDPRESGIFLTGSTFADQWVGSQNNDAMFGGVGNDNIQGGLGADTLAGEDGTDTLFGQDGADFLYGGGGLDNLNGGIDNDFLLGELGDDTMLGGDGADNLLGGDGADQMFGENNDDGLFGENGNDSILGGSGGDTVFGGNGDDSINGEAGLDTLRGEEGNDTILGGADNDAIVGGNGNDLLNGETGADTIFGEAGDDDLFGGTENDILLGGSGSDDINGGSGADQLFGEDDNDNLYGFEDADQINGGAGDDIMLGGDGADVINGSTGLDSYYGEAGNDTFVFVRSEMIAGGSDHVWDYSNTGGNNDAFTIFGATAGNIATAVVGSDVWVIVNLIGGGQHTIVVHGTTDNAAVFADITFG